RRRAGARERGGDLARDVARLADAAYHDAPAAPANELDGIEKALIEPLCEGAHGIGFDREDLAAELQHAVRACALLDALAAIGAGVARGFDHRGWSIAQGPRIPPSRMLATPFFF